MTAAEPEPRATMWTPTAVATDGDRTYVADAKNHAVWELAPDGHLLPVLRPGRPSLRTPRGLTLTPDGRLYVSDTGSNLVCCIDGDDVRTFPGFRSPGSLAAAPDGTVLVAERDGLRRLEPDGRSDPVPVPPLSRPAGIAISPAGVIYIADAGSERVLRVSPAGVVSTVAGAVDPMALPVDPTDGVARSALRARLRRPTGIAIDGAGGVVIVERDAWRLRRILPDGTIATIAELGRQAVITGTVQGVIVVTPDAISWLRPDGSLLDRRVIPFADRVSTDTARSLSGWR